MPFSQAWPAASVAGGTNPLTTSALTTTTGSTIVVLVAAASPDPTAGAVTDSKSNTYTRMTATPDGPVQGRHMQGYLSENVTGGSGHTITFSTPNGDAILLAAELSGMLAASFDQQARASGNSTSLSSGNITSTDTADIVGFLMAESSTGAFTATGGATSRASYDAGALSLEAMLQVEDSQAAGTNSATATYSVSGGWVALVGSFKTAPVVATLDQEGFRFRNDDGSETTATWQAAQDTTVTLVPDQTVRLRALINGTNDPSSQSFKLQYRKVGDASWRDIDS